MLTLTDPTTVPAPPGGLYSHAARVDVGTGAIVFVSGQVALDDDGRITGDMAQQSARVFQLIERILAAHGATFDDVVAIRTYLTDMTQVRAHGAVRTRHITGTPPTSTTVEVSRLFRPEALVEVDVVAAVRG